MPDQLHSTPELSPDELLRAFIQAAPHLAHLIPQGIRLTISTAKLVLHETSTLRDDDTDLYTATLPLRRADGTISATVELATDIGEALACEKSQRERERLLEASLAMQTALGQALNVDAVMKIALEKALELTGLDDDQDMGIILEIDPRDGQLLPRHHKNILPEFAADIQQHPIQLGEGIAGRVAQTGQPELIDDLAQEPQNLQRSVVHKQGNRSLACIPLKAKGELLGIMSVGSKREHRFTQREFRLLAELGMQVIGVALDRARRFQQVQAEIEQQQQRQAQMARQAELVAVQKLAAGLGHEMNNPLTSVIGFSQLVQDAVADSTLLRDLSLIESGAQRCAGIIRDLISLTSHTVPNRTYSSINQTIQEALDSGQSDLERAGWTISFDLEPSLPNTMFDMPQMYQVFRYILQHLQPTTDGERLDIQTTVVKRTDDWAIRVQFTRQTPGRLAPASSHDLGLGLLIADSIVRAHGGEMHLDDAQTTCSVIDLPILTPPLQMETVRVVSAQKTQTPLAASNIPPTHMDRQWPLAE